MKKLLTILALFTALQTYADGVDKCFNHLFKSRELITIQAPEAIKAPIYKDYYMTSYTEVQILVNYEVVYSFHINRCRPSASKHFLP